MFFYLYFAALALVGAVASGMLHWAWAVLVGVGLFIVLRKFVTASHITDGDEATDEHGKFRDPAVQGPATGAQTDDVRSARRTLG